MNKKILLVYNCCGISINENSDYYISSIMSFQRQQKIENFDIVVSGCLLSKIAKEILINNLENVNINFIEEKHPVNVTMNHTVLETVKRKGKYYGYMYVDSGTNMDLCPGGLSKLFDLIMTDEYGMVSPQPQNDTEYFYGLKVGNYYGDDETARNILFKNGNYTIPVGRAFASHNNIVHHKLFDYYNKVYPDIFAGYCTESVFTFLCAALKMKWLLVKDVMFSHHRSLDGPSSGFNPGNYQKNTGRPLWDHPYKISSIIERIDGGIQYGLGYEECHNIRKHLPECFDGYFCKNEILKDYIRDNLFLKKEELDYDNIEHTFIEKI